MDENIHILKADEYILHDYFENQIRENQEQEYYITAGIEEIKDMYRSLKDSIQKRQDIIEQYTNQICKTTQVYNEVMNEFDMIVERYSRYNPKLSIEDILKHPRVMVKKPIRDKYRDELRQLQIILKNYKDLYSQELEESIIEFQKLKDKFAVYSASLGINHQLE